MIDLTHAEANTLRMALTHDHVCFHVLAQVLTVDRETLAAGINGLARRGLIQVGCDGHGEAVVQPGRPAALRRLMGEAGLSADLHAALAVRTCLQELDAHDPPGSVRVGSMEAVTVRAQSWRRGARQRYVSVHAGPPPTATRMRRTFAVAKRLAAKGIEVLVVYPLHHLSPAMRAHAEQLRRHGVRLIFVPHTSHRLMIVDDQRVVVVVRQAGSGPADSAVFIEDAALTRAFGAYADALSDVACRHLSEPVVRTILLLASGAKDSAAAKQLGVTERQFRRYVATALDELQACSRFQAGLKAAHLIHLPFTWPAIDFDRSSAAPRRGMS